MSARVWRGRILALDAHVAATIGQPTALPQHASNLQGPLPGPDKVRRGAFPRCVEAQVGRVWLGKTDQLFKMCQEVPKCGHWHGSSSVVNWATGRRLTGRTSCTFLAGSPRSARQAMGLKVPCYWVREMGKKRNQRSTSENEVQKPSRK